MTEGRKLNPFTDMPSLGTHDGRRAWAFLATCGAGMVFTCIIIISMFALWETPGFIFWLALAAHIQVFMVIGAIGWAMGRRMQAEANRDGVKFDDRPTGKE